MRISCDSNYAVYINDALAAFGQYADYPWYKVYDEIELSTFFTVGVNCIKIIVWYYGENFSTYYKGKPGVWYEWEIGDKTVCVSSRRTLCCKSENYLNGLQKIITPQLGYSFCYDTCVYRPINRCVLGERSEGILIDEAKHMYDLGRERAGLLFIRFEAEKEAKLKISYGEHITDGCVRSEINGRSFSVELIGCGKSFDLILNALLVFALLRLRAIAIKLKENTSKVDKLIPLINEAIRNVFYDEKIGLFSTFAGEMHFSETGNALAILCGAAGESSGAVAKKIAASELLPASLSMKCFSYDALLQTDFALYRQYIMDDIDSRYGRMLERNAASFWETEDGERAFDGAGSLCHGWSAMPIYYYRLLCGQPTPSDMVL